MNPITPFRHCELRTALNLDWARSAADRPVPRLWRLAAPCLADCVWVAHVLRLVGSHPDPVLHTLLTLCRGGDLLAGRVVLQAMLGKLVRMAGCDAAAGLDDYVAAMWFRIRTYPLEERPVRIAANLALDTLKLVQRPSRADRLEVTPYPPSAFIDGIVELPVEQTDNELAAHRVIRAATDLGLIDADTGAVLTSVYADGLTGASAARLHGKSAGAIRIQCHRAVRRLAQHRELLADAA